MAAIMERVTDDVILAFMCDVYDYKVPRRNPWEPGRHFPARVAESLELYGFRWECADRGMWAIVTMEWTRKLAAYLRGMRVLEVMAGAGWLARALADHGVEVVATDNNSWARQHKLARPVYDVIQMDAIDAVHVATADALMVSWPPQDDTTIVDVARAWGPSKPIVYVGEWAGGCNAPGAFFAGWNSAITLPIPVWPSMKDGVEIGYWKG
jgi:uncharacterized UPF0146 family protein